MQGIDEFIKTTQPRDFDLLGPALKAGLGGGSIQAMVEDRRQQGTRHVGARQGRRSLEQCRHPALLVVIQ